ncbi:hypothetical protein CC80DRAFT_354357, partial [Byssothecium circinans]
ALQRNLQLVKLLHDNHQASIDGVDVMGRNALHIAVVSGEEEIVRYVLSIHPEFVNSPDSRGWTPL